MARYDKYDPIANGFRADIAADFPDADLGKIFGAGLDTAGKVVKGAGNSGVIGVLVVTSKPGMVGPQRQIARVDIMRNGCVTDFGPTAGTPGVTFGAAGTKYYSDTAGLITTTNTGTFVGVTVEPDRLEVNVKPL